MKMEIAKEWGHRIRAAAQYGKGLLCQWDKATGKYRYDVLGYLCEMAVEAGVIERRPAVFKRVQCMSYGTESTGFQIGWIPEEVRVWAGMSSDSGFIPPLKKTLARISDTGTVSPAEIAEAIDMYGAAL